MNMTKTIVEPKINEAIDILLEGGADMNNIRGGTKKSDRQLRIKTVILKNKTEGKKHVRKTKKLQC